MKKLLKVTTEGDCEGRSTKQLGMFYGTPHQAIAHLMVNDVKPYYHYHIQEVEVTDISGMDVGNFRVTMDSHGYVGTETEGEMPFEAMKRAKMERILDKLTEDEKDLVQEYYQR